MNGDCRHQAIADTIDRYRPGIRSLHQPAVFLFLMLTLNGVTGTVNMFRAVTHTIRRTSR
jgi:hypothetical protein